MRFAYDRTVQLYIFIDKICAEKSKLVEKDDTSITQIVAPMSYEQTGKKKFEKLLQLSSTFPSVMFSPFDKEI